MGSPYRSQHEFICVFKSGTGRHINNVELGKNGRNRTNIWQYDSAGTRARKGNNVLELHPAVEAYSKVDADTGEEVPNDRDRSPLPDAPLLSASGRQAGHDAFAVIRETIREMDKVAIVAWC
jgi:hypothetical protein